MKYEIEVNEVYSNKYIVEADSREEAIAMIYHGEGEEKQDGKVFLYLDPVTITSLKDLKLDHKKLMSLEIESLFDKIRSIVNIKEMT